MIASSESLLFQFLIERMTSISLELPTVLKQLLNVAKRVQNLPRWFDDQSVHSGHEKRFNNPTKAEILKMHATAMSCATSRGPTVANQKLDVFQTKEETNDDHTIRCLRP